MNIRKSSKQKWTLKPVIGLSNTNFALLEKCHYILRIFKIGHHFTKHYRKSYFVGNSKPQKAIQIIGLKRVKRFIDVFGNAIAKKEHIAIVRRFMQHRLSVHRKYPYGELEQACYDKLRRLNQKGILRDYTQNAKSEDIVRAV